MKKMLLSLLIFATWQVYASDAIRSYFIANTDPHLNTIANQFEIVKKLDTGYEVYVVEEKAALFLSLAKNPTLLEQNIHHKSFADNAKGYKKFADVEQTITAFANKYPQFLKLETYGETTGSRKLYALKLNTKENEGKKSELMITAATHGDELIPVEVLLKVMEELFTKYGQDSRVTKMLDDKIIYFIPVVSPESFDNRNRYVDSIDPNRGYPWPEFPANKALPVIESLMNFFNTHHFIASMDLHSYGRDVVYPWGYTTDYPPTADLGRMNDIATTITKENNYRSGTVAHAMYIAKGGSVDYYYWKNKTMALAAEIGDQNMPSIAKLSKYVDESREMLLKFIEYAY